MNEKRFNLKIKINRARYNLLFLTIMSVINIFLIITESTMRMPYSSAISRYAVEIGVAASKESGEGMQIFGLIVGCAVLFLLSLCYILSKNKPKYFVIALSLLVADTAALIIIALSTGAIADLYIILDIFIHILSIVYTVNAIKAVGELMHMPAEDIENAEKSAEMTDDDNSIENDENSDEIDASEYEDSDIDDTDYSKPIGEYNDQGAEHLVSAVYSGLEIFSVIEDASAKLIINGYVCDELDITYLNEFQLRAIVNDIDFRFEYIKTFKGETMYLYANDDLLDSLGRM